ncbi:tetratricopeptide repeat protein [Roseiconus lacunae]|uniref:Tetratricopeptide repeat protein n=1 Tax=Roseiconus lacunae TaxID=2605694 RepID=A0ABT7PEV0_9BACT|nr:tetratricopeptide repeat protein [Roseiconus lacunae]MDM4015017.1 tetratricopeptide repeat protein [Roseiconus lacunae]
MTESPTPLRDAFDALRQGQQRRAEQICETVLADSPDHAPAWYLRGILHAQSGDLETALPCFERAIELQPNSATYRYNHGLLLSNLERTGEAIDAYRAALAIEPDMLEALNNLGNCLVLEEQTDEAAEHFREVAERFPDEAIVQFNFANVLEDIGDYKACIAAFEKAIELEPNFSSARDNLGRTFAGLTEYDDALRVWREWLEHEPDNPIPRHMIAGITGEHVPPRCDDDYVLNTFDETFASSYEKQLRRIRYGVPELIRQAIESNEYEPDGSSIVLDAGCGTGLCAPVLRPFAKSLTGIDLSPDMLKLADQTGLYDRLVESELTAFLKSIDDHFDLIAIGDTLCYFGDLNEVLVAAAGCCSPTGTLVFTAENLALVHEDEQANLDHDYRLLPNGRYQHNEVYVESAVTQAGLRVTSIVKDTLRMERGRAVEGLIVTARPQ